MCNLTGKWHKHSATLFLSKNISRIQPVSKTVESPVAKRCVTDKLCSFVQTDSFCACKLADLCYSLNAVSAHSAKMLRTQVQALVSSPLFSFIEASKMLHHIQEGTKVCSSFWSFETECSIILSKKEKKSMFSWHLFNFMAELVNGATQLSCRLFSWQLKCGISYHITLICYINDNITVRVSQLRNQEHQKM